MCTNVGEEGNAYARVDSHMQELKKINMQIEKEDRHMNRVIRITRAPYQGHVFNRQKRRNRTKKQGMNTKPNTNHAVLATQLKRQVEKTVYTHDTGS